MGTGLFVFSFLAPLDAWEKTDLVVVAVQGSPPIAWFSSVNGPHFEYGFLIFKVGYLGDDGYSSSGTPPALSLPTFTPKLILFARSFYFTVLDPRLCTRALP